MKMLTAVALAAMSVVIAGCGEKDDGTRKFTVGFDADFPPYGFKDGSEYQGELFKGKPYGKGTTVFPNAELKIFVTASDEIRARRRFDELTLKGENPVYEDVLKNVRERDYIDSHRAVSPLRKADDAIVLDNSHMTFDEQDEWLMNQYLKAAKE